jgi:cytochrome c oxidase subunit 3
MDTAIKTENFVGNRYRIGMLVSLASVAMLFVSLSSAYIVRSGVTYDWYPIVVPRVLFGSTALLILGSVSIELARRKLKHGLSGTYSRYLFLTLLIGAGFLVSQLIAWRQLAAHGLYISTHPHSSFFYVLTGAHGVHIAGGLLALIFLWRRSLRSLDNARLIAKRQAAADAVAIYWHFMDALWIYLFLLLFLWR